MRMSRGIWVMGLASTLFVLGSMYITVFAYMLLCLDSCPDVSGMILRGQPLGFIDLLIPLEYLIPSLAMIVAAWIWEIVDLRRMNAGRTRVVVALFPLISIIVGGAVTLLIRVESHGRVVGYPYSVWPGTYNLVSDLSGIYALALWPLRYTRWRSGHCWSRSSRCSGGAQRNPRNLRQPPGQCEWYTGG